jgi:hypothetical protein
LLQKLSVKFLSLLIVSFSFYLTSCASPKRVGTTYPQITFSGFTEEKFLLLEGDLRFFAKNPKWSEFQIFITSSVFTLDYDARKCRVEQVSCFYSSSPKTLFLNDKFFAQSRLERLGTLMRETQELLKSETKEKAYMYEALFYSTLDTRESELLHKETILRINNK